ncbi:DcaP family trimeric outer membrane transporter [Acinetobacter indicus]|uniref:DcaP family trimeric outer membrane transporter n=1 Tax=Acinetobacter indicus TaxID=756892 RepID=UPI0025760605|nr:DcaP family trimeric outer membrane transporter [Acinetobacter indicus]
MVFIAPWVNAEDHQQQQVEELRAEIAQLKQLIINKNMVQPQPKKEVPTLGLSKSGANVQLYGFIRGDVAYQFEGAKGMFNSIHSVALEGDANKNATEDRLDSTLTTTRIGLDFKTPAQDADIGGKIEMDFRGGADKDTVRLRHVYMTYNNWLIGQTTSSFLSTETAPEMLDFNTALGGGTTRTPMLRYNKKINSNTQYFIGIEKGHDDNRLPMATIKLSHKFADGDGLVTARSLLQEVRLRDINDATELGWGAALGLRYKLTPSLQLSTNYSHVSGDNKILLASSTNQRYIQQGSGINLIDFDAFQIGATYHLNEKFRSSVGFGTLVYDDEDPITKNANKKLQQGWVNMMYKPYKALTFGAEYVYGERNTVNGLEGEDSRIGMMAKYDF